MENKNIDLPDAREFLIKIFRGNAVLVDKNGQSLGNVHGTKISTISSEGWELIEDNDNVTIGDVLHDHVIQEIDLCDLLNQHMKLVGLEEFFKQFPDPHKKEVA
jgi:hypothetical protein